MRDHANHMSWEERGVRELREEMGGKSGKMVDTGWILHLLQDGFQAVVRSSFFVATIGKLIKADTSNVSPQVLVHTLVV